MSSTYVPTALRRRAQERAAGNCEYCLLSEEDAYFSHEPDHIIAEKHGGETAFGNLCWACFDCNRFKGSDIASRDPLSGDLVPLFNPRQDDWHEHFELERGVIRASTPIGRATKRLLKFNLPERVEVRATLAKVGRYPA